jgi:4-alpha-glucanotransferase
LFKDKTTLNIVAEDLGFIDEGVYTLLRNTQYPGMKILEFAFDGDPKNEHKPSNYSFNYVVYTGTHDNMPMYQYLTDLTEEDHETLVNDVEKECQLLKVTLNKETDKELVETLVELAFASKANMCIIPMQDLLVQDGTTRMNLPSTVSTNNWSYRVKEEELSEELSMKLASLAKTYKR